MTTKNTDTKKLKLFIDHRCATDPTTWPISRKIYNEPVFAIAESSKHASEMSEFGVDFYEVDMSKACCFTV